MRYKDPTRNSKILYLLMLIDFISISCVKVRPEQPESSQFSKGITGISHLRQTKMLDPNRRQVIGRMDPVVNTSKNPPEIHFLLLKANRKGAPYRVLDELKNGTNTEIYSGVNKVNLAPSESKQKWIPAKISYDAIPVSGTVIIEKDFFSKEFPKPNQAYFAFIGPTKSAAWMNDYAPDTIAEIRSIGIDLENSPQKFGGDDIIVRAESTKDLAISQPIIVYDSSWKIAGWIIPPKPDTQTGKKHKFISIHSASVRQLLTDASKKSLSQLGNYTESNDFRSYFCTPDYIKSVLQPKHPTQPCSTQPSSTVDSCTEAQQFSAEEVAATIGRILEEERAAKAASCLSKAGPEVAEVEESAKCTVNAADVKAALNKKLKIKYEFIRNSPADSKSWIPAAMPNDAIMGYCPIWPLSFEMGKAITEFCEKKKIK